MEILISDLEFWFRLICINFDISFVWKVFKLKFNLSVDTLQFPGERAAYWNSHQPGCVETGGLWIIFSSLHSHLIIQSFHLISRCKLWRFEIFKNNSIYPPKCSSHTSYMRTSSLLHLLPPTHRSVQLSPSIPPMTSWLSEDCNVPSLL